MARPNKPWYRADRDSWFVTVGSRKVSLGVRGEKNKAEAERAWHKLMASEPKPTAPDAGTVTEAVSRFLSAVGPSLKSSTVALYRRHLDRLTAATGTTRLMAVTSVSLAGWLHGLGVGETTRAVMLRSVSAFFGWCVNQQLVPANPAAAVPKPKTRSRGAEAVISTASHARFLSLASPTLRPVLVVLHATGGRPGEVCRITADSLDVKAGVVRIEEHKSDRSGRPRLLFVSGKVLQLLRELAKKHPTGPLLLTAKNTPWTPKAVAWAVLKLRRKLGEKGTPYGYRHTFATDALAAGVPDAHVAELLGHSSTAMLHRHYSHLAAKSKVLAAAAKVVR